MHEIPPRWIEPSSSTVEPHCLGVVRGPEGDTKATFDATVEIGAEEYDRLLQCACDVYRLAEAPFAMRALERNYRAFEDVVGFATLSLALVRGRAVEDRVRVGEGVLVSLVNWLNAMRLFLDSSEAEIRRRLGKRSKALGDFRCATSTAWDTSPGYRFCYGLRNALHKGPPPMAMTVGRDTSGTEATHRVNFNLDRDRLLSDKGWNAKVREDLASLEPEIEVVGLVREAMDRLRQVFDAVHDIWLDVAIEAAAPLQDAVHRIRETRQEGTPALFSWERTEGGFRIGHMLIQEDVIRVLDDVKQGRRERNSIWTARRVCDSAGMERLPNELDPGFDILATWIAEGSATERFDATVRDYFARPGGDRAVVEGLVGAAAVFANLSSAMFGVPVESMVGQVVHELLRSRD